MLVKDGHFQGLYRGIELYLPRAALEPGLSVHAVGGGDAVEFYF